MFIPDNKSKAELIDDKLMGLEIEDEDNDYGVVCRIEQVDSNFICYTTKGFQFNAGLLLNLVAAVNRMTKAQDQRNSNNDPNIEILDPENNFSNTQVRARPKAHSKSAQMTGRIDTIARINNESINITTTVTSNDSFPERIQ